MKNTKVLTLSLPLILAACASSQNTLRVESDPVGADVFVNSAGQPSRKVGVTPISLTANELGESSSSVEVLLVKTGYERERLVLPPSAYGRTGNLIIKLGAQESSNLCRDTDLAVTKVSRGVAQIQGLVRNKNYSEAERILKSLSDEFPSVSVLYDLLGNVYYLMRDRSKALASYKKSLSLAPNNIETQNIIRRLEAGGE